MDVVTWGDDLLFIHIGIISQLFSVNLYFSF